MAPVLRERRCSELLQNSSWFLRPHVIPPGLGFPFSQPWSIAGSKEKKFGIDPQGSIQPNALRGEAGASAYSSVGLNIYLPIVSSKT